MSNFLNYKIGDRATIRKVTITSIERRTVSMPEYKESEKICFMVEDSNGKQFQISDVWVENNGEVKIKGLWFTLNSDEISPTSSLAKLMNHYKIESLGDFEGLEVDTFPDDRDFLVLVACDLTELKQ